MTTGTEAANGKTFTLSQSLEEANGTHPTPDTRKQEEEEPEEEEGSPAKSSQKAPDRLDDQYKADTILNLAQIWVVQ